MNRLSTRNWGTRAIASIALALTLVVAPVATGVAIAQDAAAPAADAPVMTDPAAPVFAAEVVPTPTLLVVQTTDKGEMVSAAILSLASADGGGTMRFFPSDLLVKLPTGDSSTLAKVYADAGPQGEIALRQVVTLSLSFDHRLVDGEQASLFLSELGALLADPGLALLLTGS